MKPDAQLQRHQGVERDWSLQMNGQQHP